MKIGVIGSGHIGAAMARLLVRAGHEVAISNSRGAETLEKFAEELGSAAEAASVEEAARFGEVALLAIPLKEFRAMPRDAFAGKVVIDAMNYYAERDGHFAELDSDSTTSSEMVAAHLEGARIVKAFNTIWFEHLLKQGDVRKPAEERRAIFIAGDDSEAKRVVTSIIESIGFGAVDLGTLRDGRSQQPGTAVYNRDVTVSAARELIVDR